MTKASQNPEKIYTPHATHPSLHNCVARPGVIGVVVLLRLRPTDLVTINWSVNLTHYSWAALDLTRRINST